MLVDPAASGTVWNGLTQIGGVGALISVGVGALLKLNQYLRKDGVDKASDLAQTDLITMLRQQVDLERTRADAERARADSIAHSMDAQTEQLSALREQVRALTLQVSQMQSKLTSMGSTP